jgi:NAD(P)-dependent dehydrogenase (short-subunit alcohol dehydrogenase family)
MASTALEGLVRGLAVDLAPLRVNLVSAGPVATELLATLPQSYGDMYVEQTLPKAIGQPEDIAEAYIYLMKDRNVTGSILYSDGGRRLAYTSRRRSNRITRNNILVFSYVHR